MNYFESISLGVLQGFTEFLPVSSSGHLRVLKELLGLGDVDILFDVLLHVATLLATFIVFRRLIGKILLALGWGLVYGPRRSAELSDDDRAYWRLAGVIVLTTFITGALGLLMKDWVEGFSISLVSGLFIATGFILLVTRFIPLGTKSLGDLGWKEGIFLGFVQGLGVLPGISRSGITISGSLGVGMNRDTAGEFSFLISLPAILGALVLSLRDLNELSGSVSLGVLGAGFVASFLVGLGSLAMLLRFVRAGKLYWFSGYLLPLGIAGLIFF